MLFALLFGTTPASHNAAKENDRPNLAEHNGANDAAPASFSVVTNETGCPNENCSKAEPPHWYKSPEWWLCILGIPTLIFVAVQSWLMKRHAEHFESLAKSAQDNASAALLNAQTLVNSQRPWIIVQTREVPRDNAAKSCFEFEGYNHGSTPAFVTKYKGPKVVWLADPDSELPHVPDYGEWDWDASLVLPRHKLTLGKVDPWSEHRVTPVGLQLVVYGLIEYKDGVTNEIHKTAFCYRRKRDKLSDMGGHLVPCGPPAYNECT